MRVLFDKYCKNRLDQTRFTRYILFVLAYILPVVFLIFIFSLFFYTAGLHSELNFENTITIQKSSACDIDAQTVTKATIIDKKNINKIKTLQSALDTSNSSLSSLYHRLYAKCFLAIICNVPISKRRAFVGTHNKFV
jgi:hypothetical protein